MGGSQPYRYWGLACAVAVVGLLAGGCSKKRPGGPSTPAAPSITEVDPGTGLVTGGDSVTISTADFQDDFTLDLPEVFFGSDPAAVTPLDSTTVTAVTPPHGIPETVDVEVRATGVVESAILLGAFTYTQGPPGPPCAVYDVTPNKGSPNGGDVVRIDGDNFDLPPLPGPSVEFGAGNLAPTVFVLSERELDVVTPVGIPGLVDVIVTTQSGPCTLSGGFEFVVPSVCTVSAVSQASGSSVGGETVYVDGMGFDLTPPPVVEFGAGNPSPGVAVQDAARLIVETPAGTAGSTVDVIVSNLAGTCLLPGAYTFEDPTLGKACSAFSVVPAQGPPEGGNIVTVYGENFDFPPASRPEVEFGSGNLVENFIDGTPDWFMVEVPAHGPGFVDVFISNRDGTCILAGGYEYLPPQPCGLASVSPASGPETGGNFITLTGSGFTQEGISVFVGSARAEPVDFVSDTEVRVRAPSGSGTVDVTVDLWGWTQCTLPGAYDFIACNGTPCQLTKVNPSPANVGDPVTIQGNWIEAGSQVFFGTSEAVIVDESGLPRDLVVQVPPPIDGLSRVDVTVIHPSGVCCTKAGAFTYGGCTITSLTRTEGTYMGGSNVAIVGGPFSMSPAPRVWFGYQECTVVIPDAPGQVFVQTPPADGQNVVDVVVMNPDGSTCICSACFDYEYECEIWSIVPDTATTNGGIPLTITGTGFDTVVIKVRFDQVYADMGSVIVDPTGSRMDLTLPASYTPGTKDVRVINELLQTRCTGVGGFNYTLPGGGSCTITAVTPDTGGLGGGETVTIEGTGFDPNTGVLIGYGACPQVTFISPTELQVVTPPLMEASHCFGCGPPLIQDVIVAPAGMDPGILVDGFSYTPPPAGTCDVTGISEDFGPVAGGNTIIVTGVDFSSNNPTVSFADQWGATTFIDSSTLSVVVPPSLTGPVTVDVWYFDDDICVAFPGCAGCYTYN